MNVSPLEERHHALIRVVADAFVRVDDWPLYPYVEAVLDHEYGLAFHDVIADMPTGVVWGVTGYGPQSPIVVGVPGLAHIDYMSDDLERFVAVVRRAAATEREYLPAPLDQPELRLTPDEVVGTVMPDGRDERALARLLALLNAENVVSFSGLREAEWHLALDSRVRRYRDVTDVNDYIARRPLPVSPASLIAAPVALPPTVFIVMPFGEPWSTNVHDMIGQARAEVAQTIEGLTWRRADEIAEPGRITDQIIAAIETADLIVADLTASNPNVMFELGYADAADKQIVLLNQDVAATPFDIKDWRQIAYDTQDLPSACEQLVTFIRGALNARSRRG